MTILSKFLNKFRRYKWIYTQNNSSVMNWFGSWRQQGPIYEPQLYAQ